MHAQPRIANVARLLACALSALLATTSIGSLPVIGAAPAEARDVTAAHTITRLPTTERIVALTFDAGSDRGFAASILDTLRDKNVRATFGMTGVWADANRDLIDRIASSGHEMINHSWNHPSFPQISSAERVSQLERTDALVSWLTGVSLKPYFRPPYGEDNADVQADLAANGYQYSIYWTVDTLGWQGLSAAEIRQRVIANLQPGAIVLMHVGEQSQDGPALAGMIDDLRARGYRFTTIDDFLQARPAQRFFTETGHGLGGGFLRYWEHYGGLPVFGYPISDEFVDAETGLVTQYFERARFEWHPGAWAQRYDVLLGLVGHEATASRRVDAPFKALPSGSNDANCTFYRETGHRLCFGFRAYWQRHGGLANFGFPISEEFQEGGHTVQYFERARFEWHPENRPPFDVLLGHLGRRAMQIDGVP